MANWCVNNVDFYGNVVALHKEMEVIVQKQTQTDHGFLPDGFEDASKSKEYNASSSDFIFDLQIIDVTENELSIQYNTKWGIGENTLSYLATKYGVDLKGVFMEEQMIPETCGYVIGVKPPEGPVKVAVCTLEKAGVHLVMDEEKIFENCDLTGAYNEFIDNAAESLALVAFNHLRDFRDTVRTDAVS